MCDIIFDQLACSISAKHLWLTVSWCSQVQTLGFEIERILVSIFCCTVRILCNKKKITWSLGDMKFLSSCWKISSSLVHCTHSGRNFVSQRCHVMSSVSQATHHAAYKGYQNQLSHANDSTMHPSGNQGLGIIPSYRNGQKKALTRVETLSTHSYFRVAPTHPKDTRQKLCETFFNKIFSITWNYCLNLNGMCTLGFHWKTQRM